MAQGIYYHPPPPFVGVGQPHEPRKLPPSELNVADQIDSPPFETSRIRSLSTVVQEWNAFEARWEPFQQRKLSPSQIAVPENDPPFGLRRSLELQRQSWPYSYNPPTLAGKFPHPTQVGPVVNAPPFGSRRLLELQRPSWSDGDVPQEQRRELMILGVALGYTHADETTAVGRFPFLRSW